MSSGFSSGESGLVLGRRQRARALVEDALDDLALRARMLPSRLRRAARKGGRRGVYVAGIYDSASADNMLATVRELERSEHHLRLALGSRDRAVPALAGATVLDSLGGGKFDNLNELFAALTIGEPDWIIVLDDDIELPRGFLNEFLFLAERFDLQLAQPALRRASHAAWAVMRRERGTVARRTRLVEIGPLTAFHGSIAAELLPFPPVKMGWGLDAHWGGLALERGWRLGVVDATPIRHELRRTGSGYDRGAAEREADSFLASRPHIDRKTALTVVERMRSWR